MRLQDVIKQQLNDIEELEQLAYFLNDLNDAEEHVIDMSDLPVFSDDVIDDTTEIWSYDDEDQIVSDGYDYVVVSRTDLYPA